ncbi:hypothetical protein X777_16443 [Ooceraea biroi]|uniref:Uncharacterized protein n=1 Tax=Ooceraea biroi TaxID=2015173 RepID=A0A026VUU9_OOCBI|nr:hypothetical protein X777_16443 [Ooceraea biroi]
MVTMHFLQLTLHGFVVVHRFSDWKYSLLRRSFLRRLLLHRPQTHTELRLGLHRCPDSRGGGSLFQSRIPRENAFSRSLGEYPIRRVSLSEILTPRIRYVVLAARCVQWIYTRITSG